MTLAEARTRLQILIQSDIEPTLSLDEINYLLGENAVADAEGNAPTAPEWKIAFDFNRAAALGWELKAAKVAHQHNVTIDGQQFATSDKQKQFLEMAKVYRQRRAKLPNSRLNSVLSKQWR